MPIPLLTRTGTVLYALALANCASNPVTGNPNFVTMSEAQEVSTGRNEGKKVREQYGTYDKAALQRYVNDIGHVIMCTSPLGKFAENHLRVINGLYPSREPVAGQSLKIVE